MAVKPEDWDQWRKELAAGKDDWIGAARDKKYGEYLKRARDRFSKHEAATVRQVKEVYRRAAAKLREEIARTTAGTLRSAHLTALGKALDAAVKTINAETLAAVQSGIRLAVEAATSGPQSVAEDLLGDVFDKPSVKWLFADINERAVMALLARTAHDGLKLSDRVWRIGQANRKALQKLIEDGVTRGLDSRKLALEIQRYLQPGVWTAFKDETRRRLGVPKNVSVEAMRLAVTELNNAFHEGTILANQAVPSYRGIYWRLSNSHPLPDVCDDYASHNGNGFWPKGEEPSKPHPFCRCVALPAMEKPEEFNERLRAWIQNPASQPGLEMWYNSTARRFLKRPSLSLLTPTSLGVKETPAEAEIKRILKKAPLQDREKLARYLLDSAGLDNCPVEILPISERGLCYFSEQSGIARVSKIVLSSKDNRPHHYQIKTVLHEITHARADGGPIDRAIIGIDKYNPVEETVVESIAHFMVKQAGIDKEIAPAYSNYLVVNLPKLKRLPEFAGCRTISDFGRVLAKYRYEKREALWGNVVEYLEKQALDIVEYAKQYQKYVEEHFDEIAELIFENQGTTDSSIREAIKQSMRRGWASYNLAEPGFTDSLIIAMNRLGVK